MVPHLVESRWYHGEVERWQRSRIGQVTITAVSDQGTFTEVTGDAGGYTLQLAPGTYTVTASGGSLQNPIFILPRNGRKKSGHRPRRRAFFPGSDHAAAGWRRR
jgi:hypothetical protein